jgi:hypothetical protein
MQLPNDGFQLTSQAAPLASRGASPCPGTGAVECGMAHQGYDLQLTRHAERGWRANFFPVGIAPLHRRRLGVGADAVAGGGEGT